MNPSPIRLPSLLRIVVTAALILTSAPRPRAADAPGSGGLGGLLVAPTRIVLEGRQRSAEVGLVNRGPGRATYRISLAPMRMTETGRIEPVEGPLEPAEAIARDLVRFSPRQVTLDSGQIQTVRLQVRKPAELAPGEYRVHMMFREIPNVEEAPAPGETVPAAGMSIELIPVYGVSIPVIVRQGDTEARVELSDLRVLPAKAGRAARLAFKIHREGTRSVHGDLTAIATGAAGSNSVIGLQKGLAVYAPNGRRDVEMPLALAPDALLDATSIQLSYVGSDGHLLAAADVPTR